MKERFKFRSAVYIIVKRDDDILILKRKNSGYMDGYYSLVAGHVDGNETLKQAAIRELKEEANIIVQEKDLELKVVCHRKNPQPIGEYLDFLFEVKNYEGEINNNEPHKAGDMHFCNINEIPKNTVPFIKKALNCYKNDINYMTEGF